MGEPFDDNWPEKSAPATPVESDTENDIGNRKKNNANNRRPKPSGGFPKTKLNFDSSGSTEKESSDQKTSCASRFDPRVFGLLLVMSLVIVFKLNSQPSLWAEESVERYQSALCTKAVKSAMSKQFFD